MFLAKYRDLHILLFPRLNDQTTNWLIWFLFPEKSSILYFYTPLLIIFTVNIIYFISTALKIRRIKYDVAKMTSEKDSNRLQNNLNNNVDKWVLEQRMI